MKLLIVTPDYPPPPGGIQTVVRNLEKGLENQGHTPIIEQIDPEQYTPTKTDYLPTGRTLSALQIFSPHFHPFFNTVYRRVTEQIDEHDPDIVHATHIRMLPALQAAESKGIPSIVTAHALELSNKRLAAAALRQATAIHAVSEFTGSIIERDHGISPNSIIHPSIDVDRYTPSVETTDESEHNVFTISRIVDRKNIETIVNAWQEVDESARGDRTLDIAGTGPKYDSLVEKTERLDSVRMLGRISEADKIERLQNADFFVLPAGGMNYDVEGFGIVYIEAQAAGTPVIGSTVGGVPEAVGDGGTLLDDETDHVELSNKMTKLLSDDTVREEYVAQARSRIDEFDIDSVATQYVELYESLL
ncbi:glycosyltransferase family 4 protein [Haloprofundus sp. MHR1]|uniref:glycosyltransferase family 4 protein n=1 Tax=Haloprofundus sp. MHR1 TaxID=2572921 RepID=UPI0010BE9572|nr:glycosyltransferase family 4 protein [Haloprofundus sp. MHR1]QCJ45972.1 glycosyltransferase family 4 protein [Haloprofundus sp. MHR1]